MKNLNNYILEKLHINKDVKDPYNYHPKDKDELIECIKEKIDKEGLGTKRKLLNLNDIDTSNIIDMSDLFDADKWWLGKLSENGYFDISLWNVSNVRYMAGMFHKSNFDGDLSKWDVRNVKDMGTMFRSSKFTGDNGDISKWNVKKVENTRYMFAWSNFNGDIDDWEFNQYLYIDKSNMFWGSPLENNPPKWYKF